MDTIDPPDIHFLNAALGWLELGDDVSAEVELSHVSNRLESHPAFIDLSWQICAARKDWDRALALGQQMVDLAPEIESGWIHRSFALHELNKTSEAKAQLEKALKRFPQNGLIRYNLACYSCQLADCEGVLFWLAEAISLEGKNRIMQMAEDDPDLEPMWKEIKKRF